MTIYLCVIGAKTIQVNWNAPHLPRANEQIYLPDFVEDTSEYASDIYIIESLQWSIINEEISVAFFLIEEVDETHNYKPFNLN